MVLTVPAVAVKVAVLDPSGTRTEAGTESALTILLARVTAAPPLGAACERVTVHVVVAEGVSETLAHESMVSDAGATTVTATALEPFRVAVTLEL